MVVPFTLQTSPGLLIVFIIIWFTCKFSILFRILHYFFASYISSLKKEIENKGVRFLHTMVQRCMIQFW